jgi:hypothetical protein
MEVGDYQIPQWGGGVAGEIRTLSADQNISCSSDTPFKCHYTKTVFVRIGPQKGLFSDTLLITASIG